MKKISLFQFIIVVFMIFGGYVPLMDYLNHKSFVLFNFSLHSSFYLVLFLLAVIALFAGILYFFFNTPYSKVILAIVVFINGLYTTIGIFVFLTLNFDLSNIPLFFLPLLFSIFELIVGRQLFREK
ncbi:putative neutral ceramidase superfamily lipid hydrolase [Paenibacillus sp. RC62]